MKSRTTRIILLLVCCWVTSVAGSTSDSQLLSISELEKLAFAAKATSEGTAVPYTEVSAARKLFLAYSEEAKVVARYRDPVPTRGALGEAVFRSVSPSVVAVVVGSLDKDNKFSREG